MERQKFQADVYLFALGSYNLIMGIQLLMTLENLEWEFESLGMEFNF